MFRSFVITALLLAAVAAEQAIASDTLYINRGNLVTVKKTNIPSFAFNNSSDFEAHNSVIKIAPGFLDLTIVNNDTVLHGFSLVGFGSITQIIKPDSIAKILLPINEGMYLYYDPVNAPSNLYMGAAGMIVVSNSKQHSFYWNLKEHEARLNDLVVHGGKFIKQTYSPDYFTINGLSYPDIQKDTSARVWGSVGDTVRIYLANTGQSMHSIHFHGFHTGCLFSTTKNIRVGWIKDTWALRSMEGVILELVVDKTGRYSVHDHNLVAVSAANTHPNGMFTIMEFK